MNRFELYINKFWHKAKENGEGITDADIAAAFTPEEVAEFQAFLQVAYTGVYKQTGALPADADLIAAWNAQVKPAPVPLTAQQLGDQVIAFIKAALK
jgi:hypothetical protein